jgi:dihydroflavonol-4-reductase
VLVRELLSKHEKVRVLIPPSEDTSPLEGLRVERFDGDVRDLESLVQAFTGAEVVYHLAGVISILPGKRQVLNQVNVVGTRNVAEACFAARVTRLVYTSSIHAIEEPPPGTVIDERWPYDPEKVLGDYAKSKARGTREVLKAATRGLDAVIVCPTGVIGPYDFRLSEMGQLMVAFAKGNLTAYMDGAYDFVDVRDVARGLMLARERWRCGESYILSGSQITVRELLLMLEDVTGARSPSLRVPGWLARAAGRLAPVYYRLTGAKPLFTSYSVDVLASNSLVSSEKARRDLGYSSRPVRESVVDAIQWFKEQGEL